LENNIPATTSKTNTDTKKQKIGCLTIIVIAIIALVIYYTTRSDIGAHLVARQTIQNLYIKDFDSHLVAEPKCSWQWTNTKIKKELSKSKDGLLNLLLVTLQKQLKESPNDVFMLLEKIKVINTPTGIATVKKYACVGVQGDKTLFLWPCNEGEYNNCDYAFSCCLDGFRKDTGL
jgi:hypothetical protein